MYAGKAAFYPRQISFYPCECNILIYPELYHNTVQRPLPYFGLPTETARWLEAIEIAADHPRKIQR